MPRLFPRFALTFLAASVLAGPAFAESADHYRGGWRTDSARPHTYEFVIRGSTVSGFHCTRCADATTLSPLEGTFDPEKGIAFTIRHLGLDGSLDHESKGVAKLDAGKLRVTWAGDATDGGELQQVAIKDPRGAAAATMPIAILPPGAKPPPILERRAGPGSAPAPAPYVAPGKWRDLTPQDVIGVWIGFGTGRDKQFFVIRPDDHGELYGMACGPCDNPYTMGALENFAINGDTLEFDIVHQDWGEGAVLPFDRHVKARIAMNEMRMDARRGDIPGGAPIVASLVGPIALDATRKNEVGEEP